MGLTARPTKKMELTKIDEIQKEFFEPEEKAPDAPEINVRQETENEETVKIKPRTDGRSNRKREKPGKTATINEVTAKNMIEPEYKATVGLKIADLLATEKIGGMRFTSRPYTIPRSLTIDLNRLKTKFKSRDLHYTQNELMDKMIRETLDEVTPENYFELREKALSLIKSPEQCSRRTVTLSEDTAAEMGELKANLALIANRRFSSDEIFSTLLAIAFSSLYEKNIL